MVVKGENEKREIEFELAFLRSLTPCQRFLLMDRKSREMIEIWDDCMSFPDLSVKVLRHKSCRITYRDLNWEEKTMQLEDDLAELLQHEYDHLDGILAVSRAIDGKSFALKRQSQFLK